MGYSFFFQEWKKTHFDKLRVITIKKRYLYITVIRGNNCYFSLSSESSKIDLAFDVYHVAAGETLITEDILSSKFRKSTCNIHVIFWLLKQRVFQVWNESFSDARGWVLLVDKSESY